MNSEAHLQNAHPLNKIKMIHLGVLLVLNNINI